MLFEPPKDGTVSNHESDDRVSKKWRSRLLPAILAGAWAQSCFVVPLAAVMTDGCVPRVAVKTVVDVIF